MLVVPSPNDIDPQDLTDLRSAAPRVHCIFSFPFPLPPMSGPSLPATASAPPNPESTIRSKSGSSITPRFRPLRSPAKAGRHFSTEKKVNDYVDRLNRQPGRRVDVALSAADQPDQYTLDYLINEIKPWYVYAQVSNTGTAITDEWRERFGFVDNQLSGNDDILSLDGVTDFQQSTNITGSYEFPIFSNNPEFGTDRLRVRVYGLWDQYTAADLGLLSDTFNGTDYSGGAEIAYNVLPARKHVFGSYRRRSLSEFAG